MDIRQLDYFIVSAQSGSFTKAANDLFISRQALSKAVRNLEHELGAALLTSRDNHLELTDDGRKLLNEADPIVQAYKDLERRYAGPTGKPPIRQTLSVALAHGTALSLPDRVIDAFSAAHPDILLAVEEVTTEAAIEMARNGESDISLVGSSPNYLSDFDIALVVETGVYLYIPADDPLASMEVLELADLEGRPFVTFGKRNHLHRYFIETCEAANVHPNVIMTTSDVDLLVRSAAEQHAYYFGFPPAVYTDKKECSSLIPVQMGRNDVFGTYAIKRKGTALPTSARAFWDYLAQL